MVLPLAGPRVKEKRSLACEYTKHANIHVNFLSQLVVVVTHEHSWFHAASLLTGARVQLEKGLAWSRKVLTIYLTTSP